MTNYQDLEFVGSVGAGVQRSRHPSNADTDPHGNTTMRVWSNTRSNVGIADWISVCTPPRHETEQPLDNTIIERTNSELMSGISNMPGVADALCVQVADDGIVVVVICDATDSPTDPLKFL